MKSYFKGKRARLQMSDLYLGSIGSAAGGAEVIKAEIELLRTAIQWFG